MLGYVLRMSTLRPQLFAANELVIVVQVGDHKLLLQLRLLVCGKNYFARPDILDMNRKLCILKQTLDIIYFKAGSYFTNVV